MELDNRESPDKYFDISKAEFPITVKYPAGQYDLHDWNGVSEMILSPPHGLSQIEHARTLSVKVGTKWKQLSLEGLAFIPSVAFYIVEYSRATSAHVKGYLFNGGLQDQPHILYGLGQAFDVIASAKGECELESIRTSRRRAKDNGNNNL